MQIARHLREYRAAYVGTRGGSLDAAPPPLYMSVGCAGLGIFAYFGFFGRLVERRPDFFRELQGCVGCSAGSLVSLLVALDYFARDAQLLRLVQVATDALARASTMSWRSGSIGTARMEHEGVSHELSTVARFVLERCGFHADISLEDLQRYVAVRLTFVLADLHSLQPIRVDASHPVFRSHSVCMLIKMSSAIPFLQPPIDVPPEYCILDGALLENTSLGVHPMAQTWVVHCATIPDRLTSGVPPSACVDGESGAPTNDWLERLNVLGFAARVVKCLHLQNERLVKHMVEAYCVPESVCLHIDDVSILSIMHACTHDDVEAMQRMHALGVYQLLWRTMPELVELLLYLTLWLLRALVHSASEPEAATTR